MLANTVHVPLGSHGNKREYMGLQQATAGGNQMKILEVVALVIAGATMVWLLLLMAKFIGLLAVLLMV